jgi:8-amino-7-oxononanoate synthase
MRSALIAGVKKATTSPSALLGGILGAGRKKAPSFEDLPGFEAIRLQQRLAGKIGIPVPFYRLHEAKAGTDTVIDGRPCTNFTSYDYLGLNGHPLIVAAVSEAAAQWGTSVSASRLTSGERAVHRQLEGELASLYCAEDALLFVSGHATNVTTIGTMLGEGDLIIHDSLSHNSIVVGAQLSGAHRVNFPHNDIEALDRLLGQLRGQFRHCLIVTEGLFSMDGDGPDLARLIEVKNSHSAWLMVDEAHSLGVLGKTGRGLFEHAGVDPREVDIWMGTLSKTLVSCGGYIAGPRSLIDFLKYRAPGMVYSVGLPVTSTVAALTALDLMLAEPERVTSLQANGGRFLAKAKSAGLDVGESWGLAVTPVVLGDSLQTVMLSERLLERGYATVPVLPPGVPEKAARIRFFISSGHTPEQIDGVIDNLVVERMQLSRSGVTLASIAKTPSSSGCRRWKTRNEHAGQRAAPSSQVPPAGSAGR